MICDGLANRRRALISIVPALFLAVILTSRAAVHAQAPAVSVQRLQRTQPLPRMKTSFPTALVRRLEFAQDKSAGRLTLYAAGEDKLVYRWDVLPAAGGGAKLVPQEPIAWPIYRDVRGIINALAVHRAAGRELIAFGGVGVKTPQIQLVNPAHPETQLTLLFNEGGKPILGQQRVRDLNFSSNGRLLAAAHDGEPRVVLWDLSKAGGSEQLAVSQAAVKAIDTGLRSVRRVKFDSAGSRLAVAGVDAADVSQVQIWSLSGAAPQKIPTNATAKSDCTGLEWMLDLAGKEQWVGAFGNRLLGQISGQLSDPVTALASHHGSRLCVAAGGDGGGAVQCLLLGPGGKTELELRDPPSLLISALAYSPDGEFVAAAGLAQETLAGRNVWTRQIRLWRTSGDGQPVARSPELEQADSIGGPIAKVAVIAGPGGADKIAFAWGDHRQNGGLQQTFSLLKRKQLEPITAAEQKSSAQPGVVDAAGKTRQLLVDPRGRSFLATDAKGGEAPWGPLPRLGKDPPVCAALAGNRLALGYVSGILICDLPALQSVWNQVKGQGDAAIDSQGKELAERSILRAYYGHAGRLTCLAFAAKGTWLASGSADGTITAWSLEGLESRSKLGPLGLSLALTRDRNLMVSDDPAANTPAWEAGFRKGQIISQVQVAGTTVSPANWQTALERAVPGREIYVLTQAKDGTGKNVPQDMLTRVAHEAMWTFYPQQDGNWWMATPQGLFDASPSSLPRLEFQLNANSQFAVTRSFIESSPWLRPAGDFVDLLGGKTGRDTLDQVIRDRRPEKPLDLVLPPQLDLTLEGNPSRARFKARAVDEEIREVSLWINSRRVASQEQSQVETPIDARFLREKDNILTGVALIKGRNGPDVARSTVVRLSDPAVPPQKQRKLHFLGVGVTEFQQEAINSALKKSNPQSRGLEALGFADQDVRAVGESLRAALDLPDWQRLPAGKTPPSAGFFRTLTADAGGELTPTEANIRRQFAELSAAAQPGDLAVVMFAGHGVGGGAKDPFQFVAQDTRTLFDRSGIDDRDFERLLGGLPCRSLVLLDSCHSGEEKSRQQLRNWPGLSLGPVVLSACRSEESSLEHPRYSHGLFSATVLELLTGQRAAIAKGASPPALPQWDADGDGWITVEELCAYVTQRTPRLCDEAAGVQHHPTLLRSVTFQDADSFLLMPAHPQPK